MPKVFLKDRRGDVIIGRARISGYNMERLAKRSGIALSTLYRRIKRPDNFTLGEVRQIEKLIHLTDEEVLYLVRIDGRL